MEIISCACLKRCFYTLSCSFFSLCLSSCFFLPLILKWFLQPEIKCTLFDFELCLLLYSGSVCFYHPVVKGFVSSLFLSSLYLKMEISSVHKNQASVNSTWSSQVVRERAMENSRLYKHTAEYYHVKPLCIYTTYVGLHLIRKKTDRIH